MALRGACRREKVELSPTARGRSRSSDRDEGLRARRGPHPPRARLRPASEGVRIAASLIEGGPPRHALHRRLHDASVLGVEPERSRPRGLPLPARSSPTSVAAPAAGVSLGERAIHRGDRVIKDGNGLVSDGETPDLRLRGRAHSCSTRPEDGREGRASRPAFVWPPRARPTTRPACTRSARPRAGRRHRVAARQEGRASASTSAGSAPHATGARGGADRRPPMDRCTGTQAPSATAAHRRPGPALLSPSGASSGGMRLAGTPELHLEGPCRRHLRRARPRRPRTAPAGPRCLISLWKPPPPARRSGEPRPPRDLRRDGRRPSRATSSPCSPR